MNNFLIIKTKPLPYWLLLLKRAIYPVHKNFAKYTTNVICMIQSYLTSD